MAFRNPRWGWLVDPALLEESHLIYGRGRTLQPLEGDPRRCQAPKKHVRPRVQCTRWALRGARACRHHGGGRRSSPGDNEIKRLSWYSKNAGPALKAKLAEMAREGPDERLSLLEEVDVARLTAERAVRLFEATCLDPDNATRASDELKAAATAACRQALGYVADMGLKAAKARAMNEATVDVEQLGYIVSQVSAIVEREVAAKLGEEGRDISERVAKAMREIKLPGRQRAEAVIVDARERAEEIRRQLVAMEESVPEAAVDEKGAA